jgi:hypothetical protein
MSSYYGAGRERLPATYVFLYPVLSALYTIWIIGLQPLTSYAQTPIYSADSLVFFEPRTHKFLVPIEPHITNLWIQRVYSEHTHTVHVRVNPTDTIIYQLDMRNGGMRIRHFDPLPEGVVRLAAIPGSGDLYIYDDGVGRVFLLPEEGPMRRIDTSFNHKNQKGHTGWVDSDRSIYAFGGYGLFIFKSFVTRFSPRSGEWFIVGVVDESEMPAPQASAVAYPDIARNQIYLAARFGLHHPYPRNVVNEFNKWDSTHMYRFNYQTGRWNYLGETPWNIRLEHSTMPSVHPDGRFFLAPAIRNGNRPDIAIWFPETGRSRYLSDFPVQTHGADAPDYVFWSTHDDSYYLNTLNLVWSTHQIVLVFDRVTFSAPDNFVSKYGRAEKIPLWALSRWLPADGVELDNVISWGGLGLLLSLAAGGFVLRRRRRMQGTHQNGSNTVEDRSDTTILPSDYTYPVFGDTVPVKVDAEPSNIVESTLLRVEPSAEANILYIIARSGRRVPVKSPLDVKLLTMLLNHARDVEFRYTTSDEIDEALIPTHPSPDYIRRMRNLTLARVENLFLEASGGVPGGNVSMFILRRNTVSDRRKFEYRLNDKLVAVHPAVI